MSSDQSTTGSTPPPGYSGGSFSSGAAPEASPDPGMSYEQAPEPTSPPNRTGLWAGAALFAIATLIVVLDATGGDHGIGQVIGACLRNVFLGVMVAVLANFLIKRQPNDQASWKSINVRTPDGGAMNVGGGALILGGAAALVLALALGAPGGTGSAVAGNTSNCSGADPVKSLPGSAQQASPNQLAAVFGDDPDGLSLFGSAYTLGSGKDQAIALVVGGTGTQVSGVLENFAAVKRTQGFSEIPTKIGATMATRFDSPSGTQTAFAAHAGCFDVMVSAPSSATATHWATELLSTK